VHESSTAKQNGGGGGIRTRVPKYQIKSLYMFSLLFNLPTGTSADGISDGQPFEASPNALKANERSGYPASDVFTAPQAEPQDGLFYLENSACQWSNTLNHLHGCKELVH